jgi:hypothetical protein
MVIDSCRYSSRLIKLLAASKAKVVPVQAMMACWEEEVYFHSYLTSTLDEGM